MRRQLMYWSRQAGRLAPVGAAFVAFAPEEVYRAAWMCVTIIAPPEDSA